MTMMTQLNATVSVQSTSKRRQLIENKSTALYTLPVFTGRVGHPCYPRPVNTDSASPHSESCEQHKRIQQTMHNLLAENAENNMPK